MLKFCEIESQAKMWEVEPCGQAVDRRCLLRTWMGTGIHNEIGKDAQFE
jgi:hypothetical protein